MHKPKDDRQRKSEDGRGKWVAEWTGGVVSAVFGLGSLFLLLVVLFASGTVLVNGEPMAIEEFRLIGIAVSVGTGLVSGSLALVTYGIYHRRPWFRAVLVGLATVILMGGVVTNVMVGEWGFAALGTLFAVVVLTTLWLILFRNGRVDEFLED